MKEVFGPITGFRIIEGPEGAPKRLELKIDSRGIEQSELKGLRWERTLHPLDKIVASKEGGNLVLVLSGERYVLQAKKPERFIKKIDEVRSKAEERQLTLEARGRRCPICQSRGASVLCSKCAEYVCERHSNVIGEAPYCLRCKIVCPWCKSEQISSGKRGFKLGRAVVGSLVGGVILGGLIGAAGRSSVELMCHTCGHRWQPKI